MQGVASALVPWQGFYSTTAQAAATLVGLLFVAASVRSGVFTPQSGNGMRVFVSPTVVAFSTVVATCLTSLAPLRALWPHGLIIAGVGLFGVAYSGLVLRNMIRHGMMQKIDLEDRLYYAALPALTYLGVAGAGTLLLLGFSQGCHLLALSVCVLLVIGIRNAWDITTWTVLRAGG